MTSTFWKCCQFRCCRPVVIFWLFWLGKWVVMNCQGVHNPTLHRFIRPHEASVFPFCGNQMVMWNKVGCIQTSGAWFPILAARASNQQKISFVKHVTAYLGKQQRGSIPRTPCPVMFVPRLHSPFYSIDVEFLLSPIPSKNSMDLKQKQRERPWEHVAGPRKANQSSNFKMQVSAVMHSLSSQKIFQEALRREALNNPVALQHHWHTIRTFW